MLLQLGSQVPEFSLPDTQGSLFSRSEALGRPLLVMFWCNHCPFVQHIRPAILECTKTFRARGVTVIAINSNDPAAVPSDSLAHMQAEAEQLGAKIIAFVAATASSSERASVLQVFVLD